MSPCVSAQCHVRCWEHWSPLCSLADDYIAQMLVSQDQILSTTPSHWDLCEIEASTGAQEQNRSETAQQVLM